MRGAYGVQGFLWRSIGVSLTALALTALAACSGGSAPTPTATVEPTSAPAAGPTATPPPDAAQAAGPTPTLVVPGVDTDNPESTATPASAPVTGPDATPSTHHPTSAPALPDVDTEKVFHDYFDIASGSGPGSEVIGRINLERNRNVARSPVPGDYTFAVIEDDSGGMFDLRAERDSDGRLFGVFSVADGQTTQTGSYSLRVELRQGSTVMARFTAPVTVARRTQWDIYYDRAVDFVESRGRLTGRRNYKDAEVATLIAELEANDGAFEGMRFYNALTPAEWQAIGAQALGNDLQEAANRIGGLGRAYSESRTYGPPGRDTDRERLRNAIYLAVIAYVDHFPLGDFANSEAIPYGDRTHQWLYSDPISGAAVLIYRDLIADLQNGVQLARPPRGSFSGCSIGSTSTYPTGGVCLPTSATTYRSS